MPAENRKSVRILTTPVPQEAPPSPFARTLGERPRTDSFAIASVGDVGGLFSSGWMLVQAADEVGRLSRLTAELERLSAQRVSNADVLLLLAQLAASRGDASGLAGLPAGTYPSAGGMCEILDDGKIVVAGQRQYLAGSGSLTDQCVNKMIEMTGISTAEAVTLASRNPSELLGFDVVELKTGSRADLILYDESTSNAPINIRATLADGVLRSGTLVR